MDDLTTAQPISVSDVSENGVPAPDLTEKTRAQRYTNSLLNASVYTSTVGGVEVTVAPALPGSYPVYRAMLRDATIALARAVASAPVLAGSWSYEARDGVSDDRVKLVRQIMEAHEMGLKRQCLRAWDYGCQSFELVWEAVDKAVLGLVVQNDTLPSTVYRLKKIKPLLPDLTTPLLDENGNLIALRNGWLTGGSINAGSNAWTQVMEGDLVAGKFFHFVNDQSGDDPYGSPRLEAVRDSWNEWRDANENLKRLTRKCSGTVAVGHYPLGESIDTSGNKIDNYAAMMSALRDLVQLKAVAVPNMFVSEDNMRAAAELAAESAWKFDFLDAGNTGPAISGLIEALGHKDSRKMRGYLVPERSATEAQLAGSRADSEAQGDVAVIIAELAHREMCAAINKSIVDWVLRYNFGEEAVGSVWITPAKLNDATRAFFAQVFNTLMSNPATVDYILRKVDIDAILDQLDLPKIEEVVDENAADATDVVADGEDEGVDESQRGILDEGQEGPLGASQVGSESPQLQPGDPTAGEPGIQTEPVSEEQSVAATTENLRATVGGSTAVRELQKDYYAGKLPREACMANATLVFGFKPEEAAQLFPEIAPKALVEPPPNPFADPNAPPPDPNADPNALQSSDEEGNSFADEGEEGEDEDEEGKKRRPFEMGRRDNDDEDGVWRTINGRAVFIKDGEDLGSAMERAGMKGDDQVNDVRAISKSAQADHAAGDQRDAVTYLAYRANDPQVLALAAKIQSKSSKAAMYDVFESFDGWQRGPESLKAINEWRAAKALGGNDSAPALLKKELKTSLSDVQLKAYEARQQIVQAGLRERHGDTITVYRGISGKQARSLREKAADTADLPVRALISFTRSRRSARDFAGKNGVVVEAQIPVSDVFVTRDAMPRPIVSFSDDAGEVVVINKLSTRKVKIIE